MTKKPKEIWFHYRSGSSPGVFAWPIHWKGVVLVVFVLGVLGILNVVLRPELPTLLIIAGSFIVFAVFGAIVIRHSASNRGE